MSIRVSIVEDERPFRTALAELIQCSTGLELLAAYVHAEEALRRLAVSVPDVLLLDLNLPRMSGIECARRIKEQWPGLKIVMLTKYEDADKIFQALEAGANGYLVKRKAPMEIVAAITDAFAGRAPMSSEVAVRVVSFFHQRGRQNPEVQQLSPREYEVLHCLAQGLLYKEIAHKLGISYPTVNGHIKSVYEKLHVHSRIAAVAKFGGSILPSDV